jgi:ElaB/YqjD/DUF883 family membrane-anchored ribosome-binding protein
VTQSLPISEEQKAQVSQKADQLTGQVTSQVNRQISTRAADLGQQASTIAQALHTTGSQLEEQGQPGPGRVVHMAADRADQLGQYMSTSDPQQILSDVEDLCRRQPWLAIAGGLALGFVGARFLKASSARRYDTRYGYPSTPALPNGRVVDGTYPYAPSGYADGQYGSEGYASDPLRAGTYNLQSEGDVADLETHREGGI